MQLPEILFGKSSLQLHDEVSGFLLHFDARGALKRWMQLFIAGDYEVIKVQEARKWKTRRHVDINVKPQEYDWTWGTDYMGMSCLIPAKNGEEMPHEGDKSSPVFTTNGSAVTWVQCPPGGIDRSLLEDRSIPILFYDEVPLYEDFIHDHGIVRLSVKIRVMPQCWYVLLRYWLRVDGVVMKVYDTRVFHVLGHPHVFREHTRQSVTFKALGERGLSTSASFYSDAHIALPFMEPVSGHPNPVHEMALLCTKEATR
ncbi:unnamed protein product [Discosporangium mesarthrocarpum]